MRELLKKLVSLNANSEEGSWIDLHFTAFETAAIFNTVFSQISRKIRKNPITVTDELFQQVDNEFPGLIFNGFSLDRLCRVFCLSLLVATDKKTYFTVIEALFLTADLNEQVGIYSALPVLAWPELWEKRCAEGVRSNMSPVLEAIMYFNPYPFQNLDEQAWNQLVLKAFFTDKKLQNITGLFARNHRDLALILVDYARERRSAEREVDPILWRLVGPFACAGLMADFNLVINSDNKMAKKMLAEGIFKSNFEPARILVREMGFSETTD